MYYTESSRLIDRSPTDKGALTMLDRELARVYHPSQRGYIEEALLSSKTGIGLAEVRRWMKAYLRAGIADSYAQVECCGEGQDPADGNCSDCGSPLQSASPTGITCYRVRVQPLEPAYTSEAQPSDPEVFISYRRPETARLASDLYYSLMREGHSTFLDKGGIAVGADATDTFLRAASSAKYFIALVSKSYFESDFCKMEIAHAARAGNRLIRVNVPPSPSAPPDMPWIDSPNWLSRPGCGKGLDVALEQALLSAIKIPRSAGTIADLRREGCQFLLEQMTPGDVTRLWTRLPWMNDFTPVAAKQENVRLILQESTGQRLSTLCNALAP